MGASITASYLNTLRPRQNGRHFPDDIFKWFFVSENAWISIKISLKCVPKDPIHNIPVLVQIMAWRRPGDKPLSEPMVIRLPTQICVARPQWVILSSPEQNGCAFANGIFRCIFVNGNFAFWVKFHWRLFRMIQLTITHHWFRYWLSVE